MQPLIALLISVVVLWSVGRAGVTLFQSTGLILRISMALMLLLTASGHWGKRRADLIRMVPAAFSRPDIIVTVTGVLEILGAIGLLLAGTFRLASECLILLLIAMFPANMRAARENLTIAGRRVPSIPVRAAIQLVFVAALIGAAWLK